MVTPALQVELTSRVVHLGAILQVGRLGAGKAAEHAVRGNCGGSLGDGRFYWADGPGAWVDASPAGPDRKRPPDVTWRTMVSVVLAGLSPGALAGGSWAYGQYVEALELAGSWDCYRCGRTSLACSHNHDPLAASTVFRPFTTRAMHLMAAAEAQVWDQALTVLSRPAAGQLVLAW